MLKELKFVQGAVGKKETVSGMTHFCIENGFVRAYNGMLALCSPIACDIKCKPKAAPLVQAIAKCRETITMHLTPTGKLSIRSGSFKALVECLEETQIHVEPEGERVEFDGDLLIKALKVIEPFIGVDAAPNRLWAMGVLLKGCSAYATNNVCLVEYWLGVNFPIVVNIPRAAVLEMLRIGDSPTHAQVTDKSITFHYESGKWIRSQLFETKWPDVERILNVESNPVPVPEELFIALDAIKPFMNKFGEVFITPEFIHTHYGNEEGSSYDIDFFPVPALFALEMLQKLEGVAQTIDFSTYPNPAMFFGENLRGAVIGRKL